MERLMKYVPSLLFIAFSIKGLINGFSWADSPILLIMGGLAAYYEFARQSKESLGFQKEIKEMRDTQAKLVKDLDNLNTHVSSMKLGISLKTASNR